MQILVALSGILVLTSNNLSVKHQAHIPERQYILTLRHQELKKITCLFPVCSSGF